MANATLRQAHRRQPQDVAHLRRPGRQQPPPVDAGLSCTDQATNVHAAGRARTVSGMYDDGYATGSPWPGPRHELLTLALLEDVAAVLARHGFPPLRGYALAELTASLYRLQSLCQ